jgi:hypothetical protein
MTALRRHGPELRVTSVNLGNHQGSITSTKMLSEERVFVVQPL